MRGRKQGVRRFSRDFPFQQFFQSAGEHSLPEPSIREIGGAIHGDSRIQIIFHLCSLFIVFAIEIPL
jgi:hypothetical protein